MAEIHEKRGLPVRIPPVSQNLELLCCQCRERGVYDVGLILFQEKENAPPDHYDYSFTKYFRCRQCGSAGPFEVVDAPSLLDRVRRNLAGHPSEDLLRGERRLSDGAKNQTAAQDEEHLLQIIEKDPKNAFSYSRLGTVLRKAGETSKAMEWYEKAIRLDPANIEARFNLYRKARENGDTPAAITHARTLTRHFLEGRTAETEDETELIAFSLVESLRQAPPSFREQLLSEPVKEASEPEMVFIRALLEGTGDEESLVTEAAHLLFPRTRADKSALRVIPFEDDSHETAENFHPSLRALVEAEGLAPQKLFVPVETADSGAKPVQDRHQVLLWDGTKVAIWPVPSLRGLFRGDRLPPPDMDRYPAAYLPLFAMFESHVINLSDARGDRTDQELEEIFSALRRRPDGKSLGPEHDYLWQAAALVLGSNRVSEAEYTALMNALLRSVRAWALRPISRLYLAYLRKQFGMERLDPGE